MPLTLDGTNGVSAVQAGSIQSDDLAAGVGGKVLQVVTSVTTTRTQTSSTSYVSTGLSASITPSSSSNTILIMTGQQAGNDGTSELAIVSLFRDGVDLSSGVFGFQNVGENDRTSGSVNITFSDTPNTTSSVTYDTRLKSSSGTNVETGSAPDTPYTMILMEIAG